MKRPKPKTKKDIFLTGFIAPHTPEEMQEWAATRKEIEHSVRNLNDTFEVPEDGAPFSSIVDSAARKAEPLIPSMQDFLQEDDGI